MPKKTVLSPFPNVDSAAALLMRYSLFLHLGQGQLAGFKTQAAFALLIGGYAVISDSGFHVSKSFLPLFIPSKGESLSISGFCK